MSIGKWALSGRVLQWQRRYKKLKQLLAAVGYVCPGSLVERYMPCGKSACRCAADLKNLHGPYYEWSRKVRGKTVTVRLSQEAAGLYKEFTNNGRICKKLFSQMQMISIQVAKAMAEEMEKQ